MESIRDIRIRLKSINSTKQITESMRLVATRKVQRAKDRMGVNSSYLKQSVDVVRSIASNPLLRQHEYIKSREVKKSLIIMITGDRGLCGGYNVNAGKAAYSLAKKLGNCTVIAIGSKGKDYFYRRQKTDLKVFKGLSENPFFQDAQIIGSMALEMYDDKTVDQVYLVHTKYYSMLSQTPEALRLLPLDIADDDNAVNLDNVMKYEPGTEAFFKSAVSTYVYSTLFGAMLESAVCEQSSRITGMDSAVKNSNKIIDSLNLMYNQMRQGAITQEIAEIVGGANAIEQSN